MSSPAEVPRDEVAAALAARRELGPDFEPEVIDSLVDRIDRVIDARVQARLAESFEDSKKKTADDDGAIWLALGSLGLGIPITAISGGTGGVWGIIAVWSGIAVVNLAYAIGRVGRGRR
ncbi:MAG: hypothetical protein GEV03_07350 [Streptosporangiales bacterium]|nr:hypothetical protein [Streptosporangiales bacterium]